MSRTIPYQASAHSLISTMILYVCMYVGQRTCPSEIRFRNGFKDFDIGLQGDNDNDVAVRGDPPFSNPLSVTDRLYITQEWVIYNLSVTWDGLKTFYQ